jgi:hypothetical protein
MGSRQAIYSGKKTAFTRGEYEYQLLRGIPEVHVDHLVRSNYGVNYDDLLVSKL